MNFRVQTHLPVNAPPFFYSPPAVLLDDERGLARLDYQPGRPPAFSIVPTDWEGRERVGAGR